METPKTKLFKKRYLEVYDCSNDYDKLYNIFFKNRTKAGYLDNNTICCLVEIQESKLDTMGIKINYTKLGRMIRKLQDTKQIHIISEVYLIPNTSNEKIKKDWFIAKCKELKLIYLPPINLKVENENS